MPPPRGLIGKLALAVISLGLWLAALELGARALGLGTQAAPRRVKSVDPDKRIAFLPHAHDVYRTSEFRFELKTNRFGRRDAEWSEEAIANPRHLLFVGDSFVVGYGVSDEDAIPTQLEHLLARGGPPVEVFNFGMPAAGLAAYRELVEEAFRIGIRARTVLVGVFVGNDFYANQLEPPPPAASAPPPHRPTSELLAFVRQRLSSSPRVVGTVLTLGARLGISLYDTAGSHIFLREQTPEQEQQFRSLLEILGQIAARCRAEARELRVVIFPNKLQVENAEALTLGLYDAMRPNREILDYCTDTGIPCLDLTPALLRARAERGPPFFPLDRHLTPAGSRVAAAEIARFVSDAGSAASLR